MNTPPEADLVITLRHWLMKGVYRRPDNNFFSFEKRKKSQGMGAISGEYYGCGQTNTFFDFRSCFIILDVCAGALSCNRQTY